MQPYIEQHAKTIESRTNFVKSLNVKLKQGKQTINKDQIIIIETYSTLKQIGIEVVVRKVS
jgi:phospholipid N-methyltransferase